MTVDQPYASVYTTGMGSTATPQPRNSLALTFGLLAVMSAGTFTLAVMSGGIFYASHVDAVREELQILTKGSSRPVSSETNRTAHLTFLVFTYCSPLLLAMLLGLVAGLCRLRHGSRQVTIRTPR